VGSYLLINENYLFTNLVTYYKQVPRDEMISYLSDGFPRKDDIASKE
jgi:hypothetical protein